MRGSSLRLGAAVVLLVAVVALLAAPASSYAGPVTPEGEPLYSSTADSQVSYAPIYTGASNGPNTGSVVLSRMLRVGTPRRTEAADGTGVPLSALATAWAAALAAAGGVAAAFLMRSSRMRNRPSRGGH